MSLPLRCVVCGADAPLENVVHSDSGWGILSRFGEESGLWLCPRHLALVHGYVGRIVQVHQEWTRLAAEEEHAERSRRLPPGTV